MRSQSTILVIDDDKSILEVIRIVLEEADYNVIIDHTGEYFDNPAALLPDLVLLDIQLAGHDGQTICKELKSKEETKDIPVIMISAFTKKNIKEIVKKCDANSYLAKPFDIEELTTSIKKYLPE